MYVYLVLKSEVHMTQSYIAETGPHKTAWLSIAPTKESPAGSSPEVFRVS